MTEERPLPNFEDMPEDPDDLHSVYDRIYEQADRMGARVTIVTPDMLKKRLVWDIAPCSTASEVAKMVGLQPASEEVEEMEHLQSHGRLHSVAEVAPVVQMSSVFAAEAIRGAMMVEHGEDVGSSSDLQPQALGTMIFATTMAIIAEMVDVGALHMGPIGGFDG